MKEKVLLSHEGPGLVVASCRVAAAGGRWIVMAETTGRTA